MEKRKKSSSKQKLSKERTIDNCEVQVPKIRIVADNKIFFLENDQILFDLIDLRSPHW